MSHPSTPEPRRRPFGESRATLIGAAITLAMGGVVTACAVLLIVVSFVLGDTAAQLP